MPSSVIAFMTYDEPSHTLEIRYRGRRGTYRYYNVPSQEYAAFRSAPSKGTYLNTVFKEKGYAYERVQ